MVAERACVFIGGARWPGCGRVMARLWFVELRVWFVGGGEGVSWFVWGGGERGGRGTDGLTGRCVGLGGERC